jgi:singapore isolate B (sub-type 7) whole genome shotgun sequence assembly, scaffold_4
MAVNHTVIREEKSDGTVELTASSPDEQAFVAGAFMAGVQFLGMDYETSVVKLNVLGKKERGE